MLQPIADRPLTVTSPRLGHAAFRRVRHALEALPDEEVLHVNLDAARASATVLASLPTLRRMRTEIAAALPDFPADAIKKLEDYARALGWLHACIGPKPRDAAASAAYKRASAARNALLNEAVGLASKGLLPEHALDDVPRGASYDDVGEGAVRLGRLFREHATSLAWRTNVDVVTAARAERLGRELLGFAGPRRRLRDHGLGTRQALRLRARCFTLLVRVYDLCKRAVGYLRMDDGDVERLLPSLYGKHRRRAAKAAAAHFPMRSIRSPSDAAPSHVNASS